MKRLLLLFLLCFGLALPGVAADGTSFNPTTISVKSVGASIPVGTVITWPSNSWPSDRDNWLECNGADMIEQTTIAEEQKILDYVKTIF